MTDSIFAGKLSLTDETPDELQPVSDAALQQVRSGIKYTADTYGGGEWYSSAARPLAGIQQGRMLIASPPLQQKPRPLPEPSVSYILQVREEASRLGIDFEREVARVLNRMKGINIDVAPGPFNKTAGPDPFRGISGYEMLNAEFAAAEIIKREHNLDLG